MGKYNWGSQLEESLPTQKMKFPNAPFWCRNVPIQQNKQVNIVKSDAFCGKWSLLINCMWIMIFADVDKSTVDFPPPNRRIAVNDNNDIHRQHGYVFIVATLLYLVPIGRSHYSDLRLRSRSH